MFTQEQLEQMTRDAELRRQAQAGDMGASLASPAMPDLGPEPAAGMTKDLGYTPRDAGGTDVNALPDAPPSAPAPEGPGALEKLGKGYVASQKKALDGAASVGKALVKTTPFGALLPEPATEDTGDGLTDKELAARANYKPKPPGGSGPSGGARERRPDVDIHMASGVSGSGGTYVPGHMSPDTEERDIKYGKALAPGVAGAYDMAGQREMDAAGLMHDANARNIELDRQVAVQRAAAAETAMAAQQRIQEESQREADTRLARIESLNREAQGKPEDIWGSPQIFGRFLGFIGLTLGSVLVATGNKSQQAAGMAIGMGGKAIQGLVNEDIQNKLHARGEASKAAQRETGLLHLHQQELGNRSQAVQATKLAYYDSILQQMDAYRADPKNKVNDANFANLQGQVLKDRAHIANELGKQVQSDVTDKVANKYAKAAVLGGSGGGPEFTDKPNIIRLDDGTSWSMEDSEGGAAAKTRIVALQRVKDINNQIIELRQEAYKVGVPTSREAAMKYAALMGKLQTLESQKGPLMQKSLDGSVLREQEQKRFQESDALATNGLGLGSHLNPLRDVQNHGNDTALAEQQRLITQAQNAEVAQGGAQVVEGYVTNKYGQKRRVSEYAGRNRTPERPRLAPNGFRADSGAETETNLAPTDETTPDAPDYGADTNDFKPTASSGTSSGKSHKKKK